MQIVLIGMMYSGKTTVGKQLAECLGVQWFDSDQIIEQKYGEIATIFAKYGEAYFRNIEEKVIKAVLDKKENCILSTGGGAILKESTRKRLDDCIVIFLQTGLQTLKDRARKENIADKVTEVIAKNSTDKGRPLLHKIEKLYQEREDLYIKTANYIVNTDKKCVKEVAESIYNIVKEKNLCQQL